MDEDTFLGRLLKKVVDWIAPADGSLLEGVKSVAKTIVAVPVIAFLALGTALEYIIRYVLGIGPRRTPTPAPGQDH